MQSLVSRRTINLLPPVYTVNKSTQSPSLLLSSAGFGIFVQHGKNRVSSNEERGLKITRKYIASSVNSTGEVNSLFLTIHR